jgi:ABC-2 type transport system ATP-binding protein
MDIIEAQNISKSYERKQALKDISLSVPKASIYGLLGPNGAGKTTFIRILTQIIGPDSGQIIFNGKPLQRDDIEKMGYMPEERGLYRKMKVGEQVEYFARLKGMSKDQTYEAIRYWFNVFDIKDWWGKKVEELSKGMQQKVQFITTVIHKPELIILDEPFSGFDPLNAELVSDEIIKLKEQGTTVILSTHRLESVESFCTHVSMINNSQKVIEGSIPEIRNQFKENLFEITMAGKQIAMPDFQDLGIDLIKSEENLEGNQIYHFKAPGNIKANVILQRFMPAGDILSFKEVLPSINDIFIKLVKEGK